ncbi:Fimbriae W protein [Salmonella enterica subsp. enterica serovar Typhimurium]|nr:Fimbriae W protein [Salmonella enterica subsp. enterica serovar Typhimurium]
MLRIAIKEQNSHFEHGLKIIMTRLANQWQQKIDFLPPEEIDNADIAFR